MGRLTLNVLLSFAQFEREVTGERIRDKIAASKKKGMWMGGPVPLGYDVRDRKLVINEGETAIVRHIFARYLELGSVVATIDALAREGVVTKTVMTKDGGQRGGIAWSRGGLAHLLTNRVYIGEVRHRDRHFPGEQAGIIEQDLWDRVQAQLADNRLPRTSATNLDHRYLLRGLLYDGLGRRMQGSQANRGARRYHYYITNPADALTTPGASWRMPAPDLEATVVRRLAAFLGDGPALYAAAIDVRLPEAALAEFIAKAHVAAFTVRSDPAACLEFIQRVDLRDDHVELTLSLDPLMPPASAAPSPAMHRLTIPMMRTKRGKEVRLIVGDAAPVTTPADPALFKLLAAARSAWQGMLAAGDTLLADVAQAQGYRPEQFTMLLRPATLAPCIVTAIVEGRQPVMLNRQRLATIGHLPKDWGEQRAASGSAERDRPPHRRLHRIRAASHLPTGFSGSG